MTTFVPAMNAGLDNERSARLHVSISGGGRNVVAEGRMRVTKTDPAMAVTFYGDGFSRRLFGRGVQLRLVHGVVYLSARSVTPAGKFLKLDVRELSGPVGATIRKLIRQMNPRSTFRAIQAGLRKVDYLGRESVAGTMLARYRLALETTALFKAEGRPVKPSLPERVQYDVWLDGQSRINQIHFTAGRGTRSSALVETFSDFGAPAHVTVPPKRDIIVPPGGARARV
jgi:hypothetical protein